MATSNRSASDVRYNPASNLNVSQHKFTSGTPVTLVAPANVNRISLGFGVVELLDKSYLAITAANTTDPGLPILQGGQYWYFYKDLGPLLWQPWYWWQATAGGTISVWEITINN